MDVTQVNEWLSIAANLGVFCGIVFLIIEIRQNTEAHKSDSRKALLANDQAALLVALDNPDIIQKITQKEKLTQEDQLRLSFVYSLDIRNREFEYFQYKSGALDENTWKSYRDLILMNHAGGRGRVWWEKAGREIVNDDFEAYVEELLSQVTSNDTYEILGNWDEGLSDT